MLVICLKLHSLAKLLNPLLAYSGHCPLSTCIECSEQQTVFFFIFVLTRLDDKSLRIFISNQPQQESTSIRYRSPFQSNMSMQTRTEGGLEPGEREAVLSAGGVKYC